MQVIPSQQDFLTASCQWRGEHQGIAYELSWHGRSDHSPQGTWCWYILISDQQFYPDDWAKLRLEKQDKQLAGSSWHRHWTYDSFPDLDAHGGWTYGKLTVHLGRDGQEHEHVKVGCDYAHLWDHERGFPDGRSDIERDAKRAIEKLCELFPRRRERCAYCGIFDDADKFYTARNGRRIHHTQEERLRENKWAEWLPAEPVAVGD